MHYYFDRTFLNQYITLGYPIQIYITGVYYTIASKAELVNDNMFVCYDLDGKQYEFKYKAIEHIIVNNTKIDRSKLGSKEKDGGEDSSSPEPTAPAAGGKPKSESIMLERSLIPSIMTNEGDIELVIDFSNGFVITKSFNSVENNFMNNYRLADSVNFLI